jgi:hypothetical protein
MVSRGATTHFLGPSRSQNVFILSPPLDQVPSLRIIPTATTLVAMVEVDDLRDVGRMPRMPACTANGQSRVRLSRGSAANELVRTQAAGVCPCQCGDQ